MKLLGIAVTVLLTAACGSSSSSDSGGQTSMGWTAAQLCKLATSGEIGAALGVSVPAGVPTGVNAPACVWTASDGSGATIAATDVASVGKLPFGLQGKEGAAVTPIPNLGDAAFFAAAGGDIPEAELDMKKGGHAVTITAGVAGVNMDKAQQEAIEKAIATVAAPRM